MTTIGRTLFLLALWMASITATTYTLFAAQANGNLTTLSLRDTTLDVTSNTVDCADNASWLTLDAKNRILYCLDRGIGSPTKGSLTSFAIKKGGLLKRIDRVDAPFGVVAGQYFDTDGTRGFVTAS